MIRFEKGTRWLWLFASVLLPLNLLGIVVRFIVLLANRMLSGLEALFIIIALVHLVSLLVGLVRKRPWAWYLLFFTLAVQCLYAPIANHNKKALNYEVMTKAARYMESMGSSSYTPQKPSFFDGQNVSTFLVLLLIWTLPNAVYFYKRSHLFGVAPDPLGFSNAKYKVSKPAKVPVVTSEIESTHYAKALEEIESGQLDKGTWAKAMVDAEGDDNQTKVKYISARVKQLNAIYEKSMSPEKLEVSADDTTVATSPPAKSKSEPKPTKPTATQVRPEKTRTSIAQVGHKRHYGIKGYDGSGMM